MPSGQTTWETQGTGVNDYVVEFETAKNLNYEYRHMSAFGALSRPMKLETAPGYPEQGRDVAQSACIWTKEISAGDEVRFTLEQNMRGAMSYGDAPIKMGDYLAYLHANIILNKQSTPATKVQEEMSQHRVRRVLSNPQSNIRHQLVQYLNEQYVYDIIDGFLKGMSPNLSAAKSEGGRALDLGLGAGVQVSPQHFLVAGSGFVSGIAGTAGFETNLNTDLGNLTNVAGDKFTRSFIHNMRYALTEKKIAPTVMGENGQGKWYCACDPHLLARVTDPDNNLHQDWQQSRERMASNPVFGHTALEVNDLVFFPEERLKQYKWVDNAGANVWGANIPDKRDLVVNSNVSLMMVMGNGALLEGHSGEVRVTYDEGFHGQGKTIAAHVKQSFMRTRWIPKDGRSNINIEQGGMMCAFYEDGLDFGQP